MDGPLCVTSRVEIPPAELTWRFSRSSGPGGQSVNTTDSRVELSFDVERSESLPEQLRRRALGRLDGRLVDGVLTVSAQEERSQLRNRAVAREKLAQTLREALAPPPPVRRPTKPSRASQQRRIDEKKRRGSIKRLRGDRGD
ncbi:ribosome-associated protein [Motilibacter rhizosphaerae]|uniref:Ribosome-associated protein n=1 Tax=Motilibacter rhizosphaerae TaxID=598652 RepID=A0A4V2F2E7_9ACTN|nr:ribosome-associated protein [Motilibacter rhizosphaerae]